MLSDKEKRILEAAYGVFFRYGFTRTTMGDLAAAAGLSRPALYLVYPGKAEVFAAVVQWFIESTLATMHEGLDRSWPLERQLLHVLEFAVARPFETVRTYPDAADLLSLDHTMPAIEASFVKLRDYLAELLRAPVAASALGVTAEELARALMAAMRGFKLVAADGADLRRLIALHVSMTVAALAPAPQAAVPAKARTRSKG